MAGGVAQQCGHALGWLPRPIRMQAQPKAAPASALPARRQPLRPRKASPPEQPQLAPRQQADARQPPLACSPAPSSAPSTAAVACAAAALGLGGLLAAAGPAAASELLSGLQAGAFIPGLVGDDPLREGFIQALLLIFFSEIGDKTFFIALLLALQQPRSLVFAGTFGALAVMTVISVGLGRVLHLLDEVRAALGAGPRAPLEAGR